MTQPAAENSLEELAQIDELVDRFEKAWERGTAPNIGEYLSHLPPGSNGVRKLLLIELIAADLAFRWQRHMSPNAAAAENAEIPHNPESSDLPPRPKLEDYLAAFPSLGTVAELPVDLIVEEYRVRRRFGDGPSHPEYVERFGTAGTALGNALHAVDLQFQSSTIAIVHGMKTSPESDDVSLSRREFGDYEILEEIARGGMGIVYKARQRTPNRVVALKMIKTGALASQEEVQRFRLEAEAAANLSHPSIIPVYEVGDHDDQPFFSMEHVEGSDLSEVLTKGPLAPREAAKLIRQLAEAMAHAHAHGVVHRDLKPGNILLNAEGRPRITDFGLAKQISSDSDLTATGQIVGTPNFMAPEQVSGSAQVGPAVDIYALGALLYDTLTGRPPFQMATPLDTMRKVVEEDPISPRVIDSRIDRDLETICLKCLEKDPKRRYASASELDAELGRWLEGHPIHARRVSATERMVKWVKRRPAVAGLVMASVVAVSALGGVIVGLIYNSYLQRSLAETQQARQITEAALEVAERADYFRRVVLVRAEWQDGNFGSVEPLLDDCPPAYRDWEWHYLKRLCYQHENVLPHEAVARCVAYSPDGRLIATGSGEYGIDGRVRIWDAATGEDIRTFEERFLEVHDVAFSPDGMQLAAVVPKQSLLTVWNLETGKKVFGISSEHAPTTIDYSPDGSRIIVAGQGVIALYDARTGSELWSLPVHTLEYLAVAFHPSGGRLAVGSSTGMISALDADDGSELFSIDIGAPVGRSLAFTPDGRLLAIAAADGSVKLWDFDTQVLHSQWQHHSGVGEVAFSSDGKRLASCSRDQSVKLYDVEAGREIKTIKGHTRMVLGVAFSPNGKQVASASADRTVKLWSVEANQDSSIRLRGDFSDIWQIAFSSDGTHLAAAGSPTRDPGTSGIDRVSIWSALSGQKLRSLKAHRNLATSLAFSPDGRKLATASWDRTIELWDVTTGEKLNTLAGGHDEAIRCIAYAPDRETVVTGGVDGRIVVWNIRTGKPERTLFEQKGIFWCIAVSLDSRLIAAGFVSGAREVVGSEKVTMLALDATTGREVLRFSERLGPIHSVDFSPDGRRLAWGTLNGPVRVWDLEAGKLEMSLEGHIDSVHAVSFSPNGKRLLSGGSESIRLWDLDTGEQCFSLNHFQTKSVAFSPDGCRIAAAFRDGTIRIWDGTPLDEGAADAVPLNPLPATIFK